MKICPTKIIKLILPLFVIFLTTSCSKDSDLLADYVVDENAGKPGNSIDLETGTITTSEDMMVAINILRNYKSSSTRKSAIIKKVTQPKNGKTEIKTDSTVVYTPNKDFTGKDDFNVIIEEKAPDNTTVENDSPIAVAVNPILIAKEDTVKTAADAKVVIPVLKNDTFSSKNTATVTKTTSPTKGTVVINQDNTLTYTPNSGASGTDKFTYIGQVENAEKTASTTAEGTVIVEIVKSENQGDIEMGILKAFPTAFGGGSDVTGGRGGKVISVTNLNASGSGSFREALETPGPAIIVFNVSGVINLPRGGWTLRNITDKTVLGQTAPRGGITLTGGKFRIENSKNLIIRYIRSRPILNDNGVLSSEDDRATAAFLFYGTDGLMLDHVSASFAQDKGINLFKNDGVAPNTKNITISSSLISDSNTMVNIGNNPQADMTNCQDFSFIYNLIGNTTHRTPNIEALGYAEIINNVIHGWGSRLTNTYNGVLLNHIGNYYKNPGLTAVDNVHQSVGVSEVPLIFTSKNFYTNRFSGSEIDNRSMWSQFSSTTKLSSSFFTSTMHSRTIPNPSPILTAQDAYDKVINDVGANKYLDDNGKVQTYIDEYDQSVINNVINNIRVNPLNISNWKLPNNLPNNKRPSSFDTDKDGMADEWELLHFGNLSKSAIGNDLSPGYTNIEVYAYQMDLN